MTDRRPVIGISCYLEPIDRTPWQQQASIVLPQQYVAQVERAGAIAVVLPPRVDVDAEMAGQVLGLLDGLILAGGVDIESSRYGQAPHPTAQESRRDRDSWELALADASQQIDLPVLGICRGMQVMAVAAGGDVIQHLPDVLDGSTVHLPELGVFTTHPVQVVPGSRLAGVLGDGETEVPTYHHQGIDPKSLDGKGLVPSAWHEDGTLEAVEDPTARFRVAVQWHPEMGEDPRLFEALVAAAAAGSTS